MELKNCFLIFGSFFLSLPLTVAAAVAGTTPVGLNKLSASWYVGYMLITAVLIGLIIKLVSKKSDHINLQSERIIIRQPLPAVKKVESLLPEPAPALPIMILPHIIDEVDVYLAYGRYEKAERLLRNSLMNNPHQVDLRLKLLDIYLTKKDKIAFDNELIVISKTNKLSGAIKNKINVLLENWKNFVDNTAEALVLNTEVISSLADYQQPLEPEKDNKFASMNITTKTASVMTSSYRVRVEISRAITEVLAPEPLMQKEESAAQFKTRFLQTHLDLAKEYAEIGDKDEALSLLQNIMAQGNQPQQQAALSLMATLAPEILELA